jgi:HSP20 family protein
MALIRWNPTADLMSLHSEMDRLFNEVFQGGGAGRQPARYGPDAGLAFAPVDVYRTEDSVVVEASVPGFSPEEVSVSFEGDMLTIDAQHREEGQDSGGNGQANPSPGGRQYVRQERYVGRLFRQVGLGPDLRTDDARASFSHGVLTVRIPTVPKSQPRRIPVTVEAG